MFKIEKFLFNAFIFLLPTQLAYHFWPDFSFVFGIRVDFLSPSIYLTDILLFLLFVCCFWRDKSLFTDVINKYRIQFLLIVIFILLNINHSISPILTLYKWGKVLEVLLLVVYVIKQKIYKDSYIIKLLFYSSTLFSLIGIAQFLFSKTLGGPLYLLGERSFNISTPGIALFFINGYQFLRAYSTFSHPNSLAGYLGVVLILSIFSKKISWNWLNLLSLVINAICFVLTFSTTAFIGLLIIFLIYIFSFGNIVNKTTISIFFIGTVLISLLLPIFLNGYPIAEHFQRLDVKQRVELADTATRIISHNYLFGIGLGTFVINVWLLQPVHNFYLLIFSETGFFGIALFCLAFHYLLNKTLDKKRLYLTLSVIFVLITGLSDHYFLTLQQNILLLALLYGMALM